VAGLPWVRDVAVRMRENGQVLLGELFIVPSDGADPLERIEEARRNAVALSWRINELTVQLVSRIDSGGRPSASSS
jgi:hypothetical protein